MSTNVVWLDFNDADSQSMEPQPVVESHEIKTQLTSRIEDALYYLLPAGNSRHGKFYIGDVFGNSGDSMVVELNSDRAGMWYDHATGEGGDIFDLWGRVRGFDTRLQFPQLIEDVGGWLGVSTPIQKTSTPKPKKPPMDDLGPPTGKWNYHDKDGSLLACIYRYDPPGKKKEFRPWNVKTRKGEAPEVRPLYNLPAISKANNVVLVEGEKTAQALISLGFVATTSMHGSNAPIEKTDWTPMLGKSVMIWPDKDKPGWKYAEDAAKAVKEAGADSVTILIPPEDKPKGWDAADAVAEEMDIGTFIVTSDQQEPTRKKPRIDFNDWSFSSFRGVPPERKWLIDSVLPLGVPGMVAAIGGAGKSMILVDLAAKVAMTQTGDVLPFDAFGGALIPVVGTAVVLTSEDDKDEIHRRVYNLGVDPPDDRRLRIVPLPSAGGTLPFIGTGKTGVCLTDEFYEILASCLEISDLRLLVIDPLQNFAGADVNSDPAAGAMFFSAMGRIAAETGATVLVSHHFNKTKTSIINTSEAKNSIRGTTALVNGVRWTYAFWDVSEVDAQKICKKVNQRYESESVFRGAVVKSNWPTDKTVRTYVRNPVNGLLMDKTMEVHLDGGGRPDLLEEFVSQIARSAANGQPFTRNGRAGLYDRRSELPGEFMKLPRAKLCEIADRLLESGALVLCMAKGSKSKQWLDVQGGDFALGVGDFQVGSGG